MLQKNTLGNLLDGGGVIIINEKIDSGRTVEDISILVNGGTIGLSEKIELYDRIKIILNEIMGK